MLIVCTQGTMVMVLDMNVHVHQLDMHVHMYTYRTCMYMKLQLVSKLI